MSIAELEELLPYVREWKPSWQALLDRRFRGTNDVGGLSMHYYKHYMTRWIIQVNLFRAMSSSGRDLRRSGRRSKRSTSVMISPAANGSSLDLLGMNDMYAVVCDEIIDVERDYVFDPMNTHGRDDAGVVCFWAGY